jgi:hypothetical protein
MTWDKDKPQGSTKIRYGDDAIRANNAALESAFSEGHEFATGGNQTGKHTTPTFKDNGGDPSQPTGTNELTLYNSGGLAYFLNQSGTKRDVGPIPSGTKMLFKQSSAPAGWTFKAEDNDRALINTSTEADGGATGGSWIIGLSVDGHALSVNEIPSHNHAMAQNGGYIWEHGVGSDKPDHNSGASAERVYGTSYTGGGNAHNHGISGDDGSWRPSFVKCITASKD